MKVLEKFTLILYSYIVLILAIIVCLITFGWIDAGLIGNIFYGIITGESTSKVVLVVNIIFILLSIKCIFFGSNSKEEKDEKQGVLLQNESGKLLISKETIENLVNSVALNFQNTQDVSTEVELDSENNVIVYVNLVVNNDVVIKDLSVKLQQKIKDKVKSATDLDVKEVNITIKKVSENVEG